MAPALGVLWGPEGHGAWLGGGQLVLVGALTSVSAFLLLSLLMLLLCASCHGQKKAANVHPGGDHENLMNGVSDRETFSQSVDSPGTDQAVSSSQNGPLTSVTVLTDTQDASLHLSEEMLSSQSELRSSKCPQDRELPSIPPNSALEAIGAPAAGDGTYEVVKEMVAASRDVSMEDSLYETVKELKEPPARPGLPNGTSAAPPPPGDPRRPSPPPQPAALLNGHLSPCTPERGPLCTGVEYASVDLNKKSRYSADLEAKRRSASGGSGAGAGGQAEEPKRREEEEEEEEEEDEKPPPVPEKVLDENDNQPAMLNGMAGTGLLHNGELSAIYSSVGTSRGVSVSVSVCSVPEEEKEHDYSSIAELKGLMPASSSSDLYATVRDVYPESRGSPPVEVPASASTDPGYETISLPKAAAAAEGQGLRRGPQAEPDYESVGELGLNRETSRL
ncbi:phosphoprotein associated with glycosphingolipid-enriched microdomains 1 [Aplochiton taeniatus]